LHDIALSHKAAIARDYLKQEKVRTASPSLFARSSTPVTFSYFSGSKIDNVGYFTEDDVIDNKKLFSWNKLKKIGTQ
jgi:hypothetical protein